MLMAQAVFAPIGQPFCVWTRGSRKFAIQVPPDVLTRLGMEVRVAFKRVPRRGLEIGGILVGRTECQDEDTTFWIEGFQTIESEHRSGPSYILSEPDFVLLREALAKNGTASIGIYRSQTRSQQLVLQEADTRLFEKCFDHDDALFLLACPVAARAAFFVREDGELRCVHEFGLGSPLAPSVAAQSPESPGTDLPGEPTIHPEIPPVLLAVPKPIGPSQERSSDHREGAGFKKGTWLVATLICSALVGVGIGMFSHAPRPAAAPRALPTEELHLTVEGTGGVLRLHWDPNSSAVRGASRGILHIQDGDYQLVKNISPSELSAGSVAYEPRGHDLGFRVEVSSPTASASGIVQVVNLPAAAVPIATRPAPLVKPSAEKRVTEVAPPHAPIPLRSEASTAAPAEDVPKEKKENIPPSGSRTSEGTEVAASLRRDAAPTTDFAKGPRTVAAERPAAPVSAPEPTIRVWPEAVPDTLGVRLIGKVPLLRRLRKPAKVSTPAPIVQVLPVLTKPAKDSITGPVSVDVKVDVAESGVVEKAEVTQFSDPLNVALTNSALAAAVRWKFEPARSEDLAVPSKVILHFRFTP